MIGLELWLSCVGDKAQMMGIRGVVVVSRCLLASSGGVWQSLAVSGKPQLTVEADGLLRTYGCITDGPTPSIAASLQTERSSIRHRQPARRDAVRGLLGMPSLFPSETFLPHPHIPPSLRPAGIPTGHGGYAPGCCVVCGACKSKPTGILRRDTLDISNPSRLRKIPSRNQKLSTRI
jgi:hypothetical protein